MNTWIHSLFIKLKANLVGKDEFGNKYYESKKVDWTFNRKKRSVVYNGIVEASKIPPQWFNWLHYQVDTKPSSNEKTYDWELEKLPNLTGTKHAYFPLGHVFSRSHRAKATGDYEPWNQK